VCIYQLKHHFIKNTYRTFRHDAHGVTYEPQGLWGNPEVLGNERTDWWGPWKS
jgi:hypothetical protein